MADTTEKLNSPPHDADPAAAVQARPTAAERQRTFTRWQRVQIFFATWIGYFAIQLIGHSLRWEIIGWENYQAARKLGKNAILGCWHCETVPATWFWRNRRIVAMSSLNFDGEYTSRIVRKHGYVSIRGSSSRRASRVLVEMIRAVRKGLDAGFTLDGPHGPRHVPKPGIILVSKATGASIVCFHIVPRRKWVLRKSWDQTEIPRPFTRTAIIIAAPIAVSADAGEDEQALKLREVQETLDRLGLQGEEWKSMAKGKWQMANGKS